MASEVPDRGPSDLFTRDLGTQKNVKEWVKNGETTPEAMALAGALQAKLEALRTTTKLDLLKEYKFIFDQKILGPESYDAPLDTVDARYEKQGVLYVLAENCPVLKRFFKDNPDLRYLAYGNATAQVPDVDVLPMGSTVHMVDGRVSLTRPGKPPASFMLFPWDARAQVEATYRSLIEAQSPQAAPAAAEVATAAPAVAPAPAPAAAAAPAIAAEAAEKELGLAAEWVDLKAQIEAHAHAKGLKVIVEKEWKSSDADPKRGAFSQEIRIVNDRGDDVLFSIRVPNGVTTYKDPRVSMLVQESEEIMRRNPLRPNEANQQITRLKPDVANGFKVMLYDGDVLTSFDIVAKAMSYVRPEYVRPYLRNLEKLPADEQLDRLVRMAEGYQNKALMVQEYKDAKQKKVSIDGETINVAEQTRLLTKAAAGMEAVLHNLETNGERLDADKVNFIKTALETVKALQPEQAGEVKTDSSEDARTRLKEGAFRGQDWKKVEMAYLELIQKFPERMTADDFYTGALAAAERKDYRITVDRLKQAKKRLRDGSLSQYFQGLVGRSLSYYEKKMKESP